MSRRKISIEYYKKRKEKTHVQTLEDIIQGFDNSMQSPDVPAATQPQDASRTTFLPPNPKKLKPDIDLTTEPDIAVEQPLPMVPPTQAPPGPPTSCAPGQMRTTQPFLDILHGAKDVFQSQLSSPSITTQPHTRSVIDNNLARAPIKRQHHQQRSSAGDDMAGVCSSRSKSHQSSSLTNPTERSFVPSMASSLPSAPNKAPSSVRTSPSAKRNSVGSCTHHGHSDIKRLPLGTAGRPPGSLLADLYNLGGFQSSPATMSSGRNSYDGSGDQRDSGRHRNSPDKKKAEPVVVIDEDEGGDSSRNQTRSSTGKASREPKETPHDVSEQVSGASSCGGYQNQNESKGGGQRKAEPSPSLAIPPLKELKEVRPSVTKSSPLKLNKSRDTRRSGNKERKEDTQAVSRGVAAAPVYVSAGETPDSTGTQTGIVQRHTTASSSDDVVVMDETTSKYFETSSRSKRGRSETPPVAEEVWPSASTTPSPDILTKIAPTQQVVVGKMRPQDSSSPPIKFIPQCKCNSPKNGHSSNLSDVQVTAKHHSTFAKNQSSCGSHMESKSSVSSGGKAKARLPDKAFNTIPRLSTEDFSYEKSAAVVGEKEPKPPAKKTSQTKKDVEVVFQAEEHPGGGKQYNTRAREKRQVRVSNSSDDHISEEDSDFQQQPSWSKKPPSDNTKSFYGGTLGVLLEVATDNTRKAMDNFNKRRAGRGGVTGRGRGGSSQRTVKGSTSGRGNVKAVLNEFHIPQKKPREDETTLDLNMVQIGRLISDGAFFLEVKSRELHFPFECGKTVHRPIVELKHLTSWRMNLGEGPQFIAVEVDLAVTNKLRSVLMGKFHLDGDFFKQSSQDPSQRHIIFRLAGPICQQDVESIHEMLNGLNGETLTSCEIIKEMSSEEASAFLESVKPSKPARKEVHLFLSTEMNELSLPGRDTTSDDVATITGHSSTGKGPGRNELGWVRRSTRQKRPLSRMYSATHHLAIKDIPQKKPRVGKASSKKTVLLPADEDETTLDLNMVQIGRLISDGAFNLEVKSRELHFPFEYGKLIHRPIVELKHLTSWRMNLGEGPQFIAVEVDLAVTNKLRSVLMGKFHLDGDFFKQSSQDPSQRHIIFRLAGPICQQDVTSIHEMLNGLNGETLTFCEITKEMSSEEASAFLESVKPNKPARKDVHLLSNTKMNDLSLPDRDTTSDDVATITGHSSTGRNELGVQRLDQVMDFEHGGVSKHLGQIADAMYKWEGRIAEELELTDTDTAKIKTEYPKQLELQTRAALKLWKQRRGSGATYNNLIEVFERAGYKNFADIVRSTACAGDAISAINQTAPPQ